MATVQTIYMKKSRKVLSCRVSTESGNCIHCIGFPCSSFSFPFLFLVVAFHEVVRVAESELSLLAWVDHTYADEISQNLLDKDEFKGRH